MNLLRGIAVGLGWLSGSLAGIGAVVYACGYLITRAQLYLFGLSGFFPLSADYFMQEGAKFLLDVGKRAIEQFLGLVIIAEIVLAVVLIIALPLLHWRPSLRIGLATARPRVAELVGRLHEPLPWSPAWSIYLVLLGLLALLLESNHSDFVAPLKISNVLYRTQPPAGDSPDAQIAGWLLAGDVGRLHGYFWDLFGTQVRAIVLMVAAWYATAKLAARMALLIPFVVTLALYSLYLPMAYGVLVRPMKYNVVAVHGRERPGEPPARSFLLSGTDQEFLVWDRSVPVVRWVPKREVNRVDVDGLQSLFTKPGAAR